MRRYKEQAWNMLGGNWGTAIAVTLVSSIISGAASQFYGIGTIFVGYPLLVGVSFYFINLVTGGGEFDDLFEGFRNTYIENAVTMLIKYLYVFLWSLLLIIPGIIKSLSYALVPYILADNEYNLTYNDAITESRRLMDGRKMDLFVLYLSFIGWFLLSIITFGIALLWLMPYVNAATAIFYLDIVDGEKKPVQNVTANYNQVPEADTPVQQKQKQDDEWDF